MRLLVEVPEADELRDGHELRAALRQAVYEAGFGRVTVVVVETEDVVS